MCQQEQGHLALCTSSTEDILCCCHIRCPIPQHKYLRWVRAALPAALHALLRHLVLQLSKTTEWLVVNFW